MNTEDDGFSRVRPGEDFQQRNAKWMAETFSADVGADTKERGFRFLEEALELMQANGCTKEDALKLVDYVYGRPVGELRQEVGGTLVTLAAFCNAHGIDMMNEGHTELTRCETPEVRAKIQAKQAMKRAVMGHTPLPGTSDLNRYVTLQMALGPIAPGVYLPQQSVWKITGTRSDEYGQHWLVEGEALAGIFALPRQLCSEPRDKP